MDDSNTSATKDNNKDKDPDPKSTKVRAQKAFNKDKVETEKDEASNVAILSSASNQASTVEKVDNNMADSGQLDIGGQDIQSTDNGK